jgi:hypothetical protein
MNLAVGGTGGTYSFYNPDPFAWTQWSTYATNCAVSGGICATVSNPSFELTILNAYLAEFKAQVAAGRRLVIAVTPLSNTYGTVSPATACGLGSSFSVTQLIGCLGPLEVTMINSIATTIGANFTGIFIATHEPTGLFHIAAPIFSTTDWNTANTAFCNSVKATTGWGTGIAKCGTGFLADETSYVNATIASESGVVDVIGEDAYFGVNPTGWPGTWTTLTTNCHNSVAAGFICGFDEAEIWGWCPSSGTNCEDPAWYTSCGNSIFQTSGLNPAFFYMYSHGAAVAGSAYINYFASQPIVLGSTTALNSSSNCQANSTSGYTAFVLNNLPGSVSATGTAWDQANQRGINTNAATITAVQVK